MEFLLGFDKVMNGNPTQQTCIAWERVPAWLRYSVLVLLRGWLQGLGFRAWADYLALRPKCSMYYCSGDQTPMGLPCRVGE